MEEDINILENVLETKEYGLCEITDTFYKALENLLKRYKELEEMLKHRIKYTRELEQDLFENARNHVIPISVIQNTLEELQIDRNAIKKEIEEAKKEKNKEYYADLLSHLRVNYGAIQVLKEILEKGNK